MTKLTRFNNTVKGFIHSHLPFFLVFFSLFLITALSSFWWLSFLSIVFFIWVSFNEKAYLRTCIIFLSIAIILNIFNFVILMPTKQWGDKVQADWNKTGYDSTWVANAQESINVIARSVERYKLKYGDYPNNLEDIHDIYINDLDYSYRIKEADGQTNGVPFYYKRIDSNKFYLAGVGKDGIIKTEDDLLPQISFEQERTTGLVKYVAKSFSVGEIDREQRVIEMLRKTKETQKLFNEK